MQGKRSAGQRALRVMSGSAMVPALLVGLGPKVEALYSRALKTRANGIARIEHGGCSACHRTLPPEVMNRVVAGEVHACASCHCILVPAETRA